MVESNDDVVDEDEIYNEEARMFVIITGKYKVQTVMFNMKK